ncbi:TetR/AcrR family transcriptional regulator [Methylobacterium sp.]|jgi:AcrR family transcriptional regulator|uniref:TetR/AcrR family transcriptional regulator n=1 Tax=Methylobacterium sp. TaxID=409 RepID=UPI000C413AF2|nr:TetR/AcrR family transcriptional regulator [Methylobacterium sp.]MBP32721.1 TetR family transcriptional regulator [Methylobacterium sp.]
MPRGEGRRFDFNVEASPEAGPAVPIPDTRTRILAVSLALFNARGLGRVTTAEIAAAAGIREGNLQYHFPRKSGLVEAVFAAFEAEALAVAGRMPADPAAPEALLCYQRAWFDLIWRYRCIYRDGIAMVDIAPALRPRIHALRAETQALARGVFEAAVRAGRLRIAPEALGRLIDNAWIVSSHWMNHRLQGGTTLTEADLDWGFAQLRDLFAPYLAPDSPD